MTAAAGGIDERFFASTRGQVAVLLRHSDRTVEELAHALGSTDTGCGRTWSPWSETGSCDRPGSAAEQANERPPTR
jgi:hypothetical protein